MASICYKRGRDQNTLEPEHAQELLAAYELFSDIDGLARVVNLDEIADKGYSLNIPLYVAPGPHRREGDASRCTRGPGGCAEEGRETRVKLEAELARWGLPGYHA